MRGISMVSRMAKGCELTMLMIGEPSSAPTATAFFQCSTAVGALGLVGMREVVRRMDELRERDA